MNMPHRKLVNMNMNIFNLVFMNIFIFASMSAEVKVAGSIDPTFSPTWQEFADPICLQPDINIQNYTIFLIANANATMASVGSVLITSLQ